MYKRHRDNMKAAQEKQRHKMGQIRLIPLSQVDQYLGLAGGIRNGAAFDFFGGS
jgi:hypothetical protein